MDNKDQYKGFADRYALFPPDSAARDFFRRLFAENRVARVLDCACGIGRDLILFHSLGCEVVGSDRSTSMLAKARESLAVEEIEVPLHEIDYRNLPAHFDRRFDAITCLSGSLLESSDEVEVVRGLRSMYSMLRRDGLLILSQGITDKLWRERPRFLLEANTAEVSRVFVVDYLDQGVRFNVLDIFHSPTHSGLKTWSIEYPHILLGADYQRLLSDTGFADVRLLGGYGFERYDPETSDRLIVVARK